MERKGWTLIAVSVATFMLLGLREVAGVGFEPTTSGL
jgi:hypothetical protein